MVLVGLLDFKSSSGPDEGPGWVRFPHPPAIPYSMSHPGGLSKRAICCGKMRDRGRTGLPPTVLSMKNLP